MRYYGPPYEPNCRFINISCQIRYISYFHYLVHCMMRWWYQPLPLHRFNAPIPWEPITGCLRWRKIPKSDARCLYILTLTSFLTACFSQCGLAISSVFPLPLDERFPTETLISQNSHHSPALQNVPFMVIKCFRKLSYRYPMTELRLYKFAAVAEVKGEPAVSITAGCFILWEWNFERYLKLLL